MYTRKIVSPNILFILFAIVSGCATKSIRLDNYQIIRSNYFNSSKYHLNKTDTNRVNTAFITQVVNKLSTDSFMVVKITAENMGYEEYGGYDFFTKSFFVSTSGSSKLKIIKDTLNSTFESIKITTRFLSNPGYITKETIASDSASKDKFDFGAVELSIVKIDHYKKSVLIESFHW